MPLQTEMIEIRGSGFWGVINKRDVKYIHMLPEPPTYPDMFKIIIYYYGEEEEQMTLDHRFTKEECEAFTKSLTA